MSAKVYAVALEKIWLGDIIVIEDGRARRASIKLDGLLDSIPLSGANDVVWNVQEDENERRLGTSL